MSFFTTRSFYIGVIRAAVEEYQEKHGGFGDVRVTVSHTSPDDYTCQGYASSALDGVVFEVGRIAERRERERQERFARVAALREAAERGEITEDEYLEQAYCFI